MIRSPAILELLLPDSVPEYLLGLVLLPDIELARDGGVRLLLGLNSVNALASKLSGTGIYAYQAPHRVRSPLPFLFGGKPRGTTAATTTTATGGAGT
jgi:hypothetical protein